MIDDQPYSQRRCDPAHSLIKRLGGPAEVARAIQHHAIEGDGDRRTRGLSPSTVCRWATATDQGGTGGVIPVKYWPALVKIARAKGQQLTIADLSDIAAQVAAENDGQPIGEAS